MILIAVGWFAMRAANSTIMARGKKRNQSARKNAGTICMDVEPIGDELPTNCLGNLELVGIYLLASGIILGLWFVYFSYLYVAAFDRTERTLQIFEVPFATNNRTTT